MLPENGESIILIPLRTIAVYGITLLIVRLGSKRILSKASPFDFVVSIMLGSIMSGAMTGSSPLIPTVLVGTLLLASHWLFATLAYHTNWFGKFVKGGRILLIKDGEIQDDGMLRAKLTKKDLKQALHLQTKQTDTSSVERAYMERNGDISTIQKKHAPRIISISVEKGVQTARIEPSE